jgi:hypothetical protein
MVETCIPVIAAILGFMAVCLARIASTLEDINKILREKSK